MSPYMDMGNFSINVIHSKVKKVNFLSGKNIKTHCTFGHHTQSDLGIPLTFHKKQRARKGKAEKKPEDTKLAPKKVVHGTMRECPHLDK